MRKEAFQALEKVEKRIQQCEILRELLSEKTKRLNIDYSKYTAQGYSEEEVAIGIELISLYLLLREYSTKVSE